MSQIQNWFFPLWVVFISSTVWCQEDNLSPAPAEDSIESVSVVVEADRVSDLQLSHVWSRLGDPAPRYTYLPNAASLKRIGFSGIDGFAHWSELEPLNRSLPTNFRIANYYVELATRVDLQSSLTIVTSSFVSIPEWFRNSSQYHSLTCLEHQLSSPTLSIWNPVLTGHIDRVIKNIAERFGNQLNLMILGPNGNYGEAAFPSGGGLDVSPSFHQGLEWWCGEEAARKDFRRWLLERYGSVEQVAEAWVAAVSDAAQIASATHNLILIPGEAGYEQYFADAEGMSETYQRRFLDFSTWYSEAMTAHSEFWLSRARQRRPQGRIALAMAGDGHPMRGADFTRLVRLAHRYQAEVRYAPTAQIPGLLFAMTAPLATAARFYDVDVTLDASGVQIPNGLQAFLWYAAANHLRGLALDTVFARDDTQAVRQVKPALELVNHLLADIPSGDPLIETALFVSESTVAIEHQRLLEWQAFASRLRDILDFAVVSEALIQDGFLGTQGETSSDGPERPSPVQNAAIRFLITPSNMIPPKESLPSILDFVQRGGVWIAPASSLPVDLIQEIQRENASVPVVPLEKGYIVPLLPTESGGDEFGGRLPKIVAGVFKLSGLWTPLEWPSFDDDGVFVTVRKDRSTLLFNTLDRPATVELTMKNRSQTIALETGEMKVVEE